MRKKKTGIKASRTNVSSVSQNASGVLVKPTKPVKPKKRWWSVLKVIVIIIIVKTLINITLFNYFTPDNRVKRYLHAKYGSNRELTVDGGCLADLDGGRTMLGELLQMAIVLPGVNWWPWEWSGVTICRWQASFKDDPKHIFNVWLDDNYGNRSLRSYKMERGEGLK
ncbi:hypothetical protein [Candidatus Nanoperiomorbus periodonticus]|uniref:hypothetical protein n=1 Tax=Candidatus Nanoperiomorbus periodonticus TaxID=2171989 RepID=UPI00101E0790|nr:hypothetical protein [Candidatus Nanoperiomorbus periodonticus]RYC75914.1 hypothetical protein G52EAM_00159 [Candidatus Nanoperiomorbus periodonticus]